MTLRGRSFRFSALSLSKMVEKTLLDPAALLDLDSVVVAEILATLVLGKELNLFGVYRSTTFFAD